MRTNDGPLVLELAKKAGAVGLPSDRALELARNLASAALLGPLTPQEWVELVRDSLDARMRSRCGLAWRLTPDLRGPLLAVLATPSEGT